MPDKVPFSPPPKPEKVTADSNIPGTDHGMFVEYYIFNPTSTIKGEELLEVLKAMNIVFGPELFERLPESVRKHFLVKDRTGKIARYTNRRVATLG